MLIFQGFANSRIVREFPPFSFKVRIATLTRNQVVARAARGFESHPVRQLQGFCLEQKPCFFMSSLKKFPHGHPARLTAPDNADNDDTFDVASRCEYVFAVVEKSL